MLNRFAEVAPSQFGPGIDSFEFDIALPPHLAAYGRTTRARLTGPAGAPLLVVLGGISGNRFACAGDGVKGWWPGFACSDGAASPCRFRVLGIDFIADESGASAPTPLDQAAAVLAALDAIDERKARAIIGGSYGGMVALAIGQHHADRADRLVVISAGAAPHPAATALRELQRRVVALGLQSGTADEALAIARGMAMLSYRTADEFQERFEGGISGADPLETTQPGQYLRARGTAFRNVMSPGRFLSLSASIDRHRVDPSSITLPTLLIGASSDQLVPAADMEALAAGLAGPAELHLLPSLYGHDMFLKEAVQISALVRPFIA